MFRVVGQAKSATAQSGRSSSTVNDLVVSINGIPIRITAERWQHIVEHHDDLAGHYHDVLEAIEER